LRVIKEVRWSYVLVEDEGELFLTFMSGGVFEVDFCVELTAEERRRIEVSDADDVDGAAIEALVDELLSDRDELHRRRIVPSKWPPRPSRG
jgi:hypothetical protein